MNMQIENKPGLPTEAKVKEGYKKTSLGLVPDGWKIVKLDEIASFSKGKGISKSDIIKNGDLECIRYGELYTLYSEVVSCVKSRTSMKPEHLVLSEANDIIIPASGETAIDIATASCVLRDGIALGGDLNIIKTNEDGVFLSFYLNVVKKNNIARLAQGNSVVHLYSKQLALLDLILPPLPEQKKIAQILSTWDKAIEKFEQVISEKEQLKKGLMQLLLTGKKRFPGFTEEWKYRRLEDLLDYEQPTKYIVKSTDYTDVNKTPVLTAGKTFVLGYTSETDGIYFKNLPVIIFDDFTTSSHYVDFPFKVKSSAMKILKAASESDEMKVIFELMKRIPFEPTDHKRYWISQYSLEEVKLPSLEEQKKLSKFVGAADGEIELLKNQLLSLQEEKKGLMQKLLTGVVRVKTN